MIPRVDEQIAEIVDFPLGTEHDVIIRLMSPSDIPELRSISLIRGQKTAFWYGGVTLIAEFEGRIVGFTQYYISVDGILHSDTINIIEQMKGRGIGAMLHEVKEAIAIKLGARTHMHLVSHNGDIALKKILVKRGFHLCQRHDNVEFWIKSFSGDNI